MSAVLFSTTDWAMWSAVAGIVQAFGVVAGLIFVVVQLSQARSLRLDQVRPFVLVHLVRGEGHLAAARAFAAVPAGGRR